MPRAAFALLAAAGLSAALVAQDPVGAPAGLGAPAAQGGRGRGVPIPPGEECPAGMTRVRPETCRAPELPPPSIVDYRPTSTLVVAEHPVPRAKFPVVDMHGHPGNFDSPEAVDRVVAAMDSLNLQVMVWNNRTTPERMRRNLEVVRSTPHGERFVFFTSIDIRNVGPGFAEKAVQQLEADVKAGAVGLGEFQKDFGLTARKVDGTRLRLDDPELKPIWDAAARLNIPVMLHVGDPASFFNPIDFTNERWLELALFPDRRYSDPRFPRFEELLAERDRLFRQNPETRFIMAHLGWQANDLGRVGRIFDEMPNVYGEVGAVLHELGRQPRAAHDFFVQYQDRIMFGKDAFEPSEYPYYWRTFETADDHFDYYRNYHAFWKLYGMALPDEVLRKVYFENALRVVPGIPRPGFPN
jgi:predicted TIM-barrel fold metal-dependent hydrolase